MSTLTSRSITSGSSATSSSVNRTAGCMTANARSTASSFGFQIKLSSLIINSCWKCLKYRGTRSGVTICACPHTSVGELGIGPPDAPHTHSILAAIPLAILVRSDPPLRNTASSSMAMTLMSGCALMASSTTLIPSWLIMKISASLLARISSRFFFEPCTTTHLMPGSVLKTSLAHVKVSVDKGASTIILPQRFII